MGILENLLRDVVQAGETAIRSAQNPRPGYPQRPPPRQLPLDVSANVILDVNGNGTCSLGPGFVHEHWQPGAAYVSVTTNVLEAACEIFMGSNIVSSTGLAQTSKGSTGATCSLSGDMPTGYQIWAQWSNGDAESQATLRITGTRTIGSPLQ
jgi:hypothetical protein